MTQSYFMQFHFPAIGEEGILGHQGRNFVKAILQQAQKRERTRYRDSAAVNFFRIGEKG